MKLMKIMPAALLLSLSLGAFAQDDDELLDDATAEEATEVSLPQHPWDKPIFHRVELGYRGTRAKYTSISPKYPILGEESYFLSGVSLGWLSDIILTKNNVPLYLELGAQLSYQTGTYDGTKDAIPGVRYNWHSRVYAFCLTIPVNLSYQFKDIGGVEGLTLAPFAGVYARFNLIADRSQRTIQENYNTITGVVNATDEKYETRTLKESSDNGGSGWMKGRSHAGKLIQAGVQIGANAFYKRFSFGLSYMIDLSPFASHKDTMTDCDMKISTMHNVAVTAGFVF